MVSLWFFFYSWEESPRWGRSCQNPYNRTKSPIHQGWKRSQGNFKGILFYNSRKKIVENCIVVFRISSMTKSSCSAHLGHTQITTVPTVLYRTLKTILISKKVGVSQLRFWILFLEQSSKNSVNLNRDYMTVLDFNWILGRGPKIQFFTGI